MDENTFSSSVILANLLDFTLFFVDAAPEPMSFEPPPRPPKGFIPAILCFGRLSSNSLSCRVLNFYRSIDIDITQPVL